MSGTGRFPPYEDRSPYPRNLQASWPLEHDGLHLTKQDDEGPPDQMRIIRRMIADGDSRGYHICTELWKKPPREYPPAHIGDETNGVGITLDLEEAAALWASLGNWIVRETQRQADLARAEGMV